MCPACITTAAVFAASSASGVGVLGFLAVKFKWWRRTWRVFGSLPRLSKQLEDDNGANER